MAFQSMEEYSEKVNAGKFRLPDDGDSQDVVFLYEKPADALRCDAHYLSGDDFKGYVHCLEDNCPACEAGYSKRSKLFIPMYLPTEDQFVFWDRNTSIYHQLVRDVFDKCQDPSKFVFKIVRHGEYKSRDTRYDINLINKNTMSFDEMLKSTGKKLPDAYEDICKSMDADEMRSIIKGSGAGSSASNLDEMPAYKIKPRGVEEDPAMPDGASNVISAEDIDF